jgi:trigger factor
VPGLDEVLVGMSAGDETTFQTQLVGGDLAGQNADVVVNVRTVKEKQLPDLDDAFAQLASEFDTLEELRADLAERLARAKRLEQLYVAGDKAMKALVDAADVPAPDGVVREETEHRKEAMSEQLERMGLTMADYLDTEGKTPEELDADLADASAEAVKAQLVLDTLADAESIDVSQDEFGHEIIHRAERAGVGPQQYYDQLRKAGLAGSVFADVRRAKARRLVLERVKIVDSAGNRLTLDDFRAGVDADDIGENDDHEGHVH